MGEGSWDTGQSEMTARVPPGNLTEYVTIKENKKISHKDQSSSRQLRGSYRSHKASGMFPAWRKQVNKLIKEIL